MLDVGSAGALSWPQLSVIKRIEVCSPVRVPVSVPVLYANVRIKAAKGTFRMLLHVLAVSPLVLGFALAHADTVAWFGILFYTATWFGIAVHCGLVPCCLTRVRPLCSHHYKA